MGGKDMFKHYQAKCKGNIQSRLVKEDRKHWQTYIVDNYMLNKKLAYFGVGAREEYPQTKQSENWSADNSKYFQSHLKISHIGYMLQSL